MARKSSGPRSTGDRRKTAGRPLRQRLAELLDLPKDVVLDLPRISIIGDLQVLIQNHRGVKEYTPRRVVIGMDRGSVAVTGEDLSIGVIHVEEIMVTGRVDGIRFHRS